MGQLGRTTTQKRGDGAMTLSFYILRRFLWLWGLVNLAFAALLFPIDLVEHLGRVPDSVDIFSNALVLASLNLPSALSQLQPLIVILATIALFLGLARSLELVAIRATGRSLVRSLFTPVLGAFGIGVFSLVILNPIVAGTQKAYERTLSAIEPGTENILFISDEGVWLRQADPGGQTVIRARRTSLDGTILYNASFLRFGEQDTPLERVDAVRAELKSGAWELSDVKLWPLAQSRNPERDAQRQSMYRLPSNLTTDQIRDSFGTPSAISIFQLPNFIARLDSAGFSARQHRVWFAMELAKPLMLMAMVVIGASFMLRHTRAGSVGPMILSALVLGFGIYFLRNFAQVLGESGQLSIHIAAFAPPLVGIALGYGILLHLEDG